MDQQVYVLRNSEGLTKIGISDTPIIRKSSVASDVKEPLTLLFAASTNGSAFAIEQLAHRKLKSSLARGREWFAVSDEAAIAAVEEAASELNVSLKEEPISYRERMSPEQYVDILRYLGIGHSAAAKLLRVSRQSSHSYASGATPVPRGLDTLILLLYRLGLDEYCRASGSPLPKARKPTP